VDKHQQHAMIILSTIFTAFGLLAVVLRVISRYMVVGKMGADDWYMVAGLFTMGGYLFEILYGVRFGIAQRGSTLDPSEMVTLLKVIYSIQLTYNTVIYFVKSSILFFYLRLAPSGNLRLLSWASIIFLAMFWVASEIGTILQCLPISSNWEIFNTDIQAQKKCMNTLVYFYFLAGLNILIDIWILALPIKTLSGSSGESETRSSCSLSSASAAFRAFLV